MRALLLLFLPQLAAASELDPLYERIAADLRAGKPLTVQVHVALCDNSRIVCGGHGLGDGDDLSRNLYWATSGGLRGWFERRGSGWQRVAIAKAPREGVLEEARYRRHVDPSAAWRARGVTHGFDVEVDAFAWRGREIDGALDQFMADLDSARAHVVAYVGHNGWMDRRSLAWPRAGAIPTGAIAIACLTRSYLRVPLLERSRVPLLVTTDLLFAGSHALDGALQAVAAGASLASIRDSAARAYADGESKRFERVRRAFTNPGDPRW
jgi:hypothetical protein